MSTKSGEDQGQIQEIELPERRDELRELGQAFLDMGRTLDARRKDLEASLDFNKHLIEDNPVGIAVIDEEYRIVQANKAWERIFAVQETVGHPLSASAEGEQLAAWLKAHTDAVPTGDIQIEGRDGSTRFLNLKIVQLTAEFPGDKLLVLEDETQQRSLELYVMQSEKLISLGEMAAGVAHEIKNPLAIMQNACDLLKRLDPSDEEERDKALTILRGAILRANERVGDLLDFARPSGSDQEWIDLTAVVRQLIDLERLHIRGLGIRLIEDIQDAPQVYMNRDILKDICLNLIANALDSMSEGGELSISTYGEENQAVLRIRDTGTGIPTKHLSHIFDPFYSTKPVGQGTGLGLTIAHRQIQKAGGRVQVESKEGEWTIFSVYLPSLKEQTGEAQ